MKKLLLLLFLIPNLVMGEDYKTPCLFRMTDAKNEWAAKKIYDICRDAEKNSTKKMNKELCV